ncbi:MAG: hypothetical protein IKE24_10180 [Clostridia bacterium]|nr:hypothetical protein [Clostridia bacterium]
MKTDIVKVSSWEDQIGSVLVQVEKVAAYKELTPKQTLHLRLLAEEMMGMMRSITGHMYGDFWIEDENQVYELHLQVRTVMDSEKREQLLSASSSGKNESAKGLMGRLRDFFDRGGDADVTSYASPLMLSGMYEDTTTPTLNWDWSLDRYVEAYRNEHNITREQKEAWDELEKSVVARVADDVSVSIRGGTVEMVLVKKMN